MKKCFPALFFGLLLSSHLLAYEVEEVAEGLLYPWSLAFLPNGDLLVTERSGQLRLIIDGNLRAEPVAGLPPIYVAGQGGLMDVRLHPDYEHNSLVYFSYAHGTPEENALRVARARLDGASLTDLEVIFTAAPTKATAAHYGGRLAFMADKTLLVTTGDGFDYREAAQDTSGLMGKVVRLQDDGAVPDNNPFAGQPGTSPEIWSYGHRNPQGLLFDPESGRVWLHEHGPRGGDELNLIEAGTNYGWPIATFGLNYTGAYVSPYQAYPGTEPPVVHWTPSIAPAGMAIYRGDAFPEWQGDLFVAALVEKAVRRLEMQGDQVVSQELLFAEFDERIREVRVGPDGFLYLITDGGGGRILRIRPE